MLDRLVNRRHHNGGPACLLLLAAAASASAQVVLDGKFGAAGGVAGPNFAITADMGALRGNNLFHSFQQFDLKSGDVATFSGPANVQNILARVTGQMPSSIDGTVRSQIPGANLFLINPSGFIFGPNAAIDVSGSFAAGSANYLKLSDGARFAASLDADDSALTTAPVSAFGFLSGNPGGIALQHSSLQGSDGQVLSIVGGEILMEGGSLRSPAGKINLVSVKSSGEASLDASGSIGTGFNGSFTELGAINLRNDARVDASGERGGRIVIRGGSLVVDNARIESNTTGAIDGSGIDLAITQNLDLLNGAQINSLSPSGSGAGGNIAITADTIRLDGAGLTDEFFNPVTQISSATGENFVGGGPAKGGDISLRARSIDLVNSAQISAATFGSGDAGRIDIEASSVKLDALLFTATQITANTQQIDVGGKAGDIHIHTDTLELANGATILAASFGSGPAGVIDVEARSVSILGGGIVTAGAFGAGNGGNVQIKAESIRINGADTLGGGPDLLTGIQAVTTSTEVPTPGGNIQIDAGSLNLDHNGSVFTTSFGLGNGGDIKVSAKNVSLANASTIRAAGESTGRAGKITVQSAGNFLLMDGSGISTSAPGSSGGDISVRAGSEIRLVNSEINAQAGLDGGNILVSAPNLIYLLNSTLTAQADTSGSGFGNGGNLTVEPSSFLIMNRGSLISKSSFGNGGNIAILTDNFFKSGSVIDASAPFGLAGTVSVTAPEVDLSGLIAGMANNLLDAESRLRPDCAVRLSGNLSSFVVLGRGGLPIQPGGFLPSGMVPTRNETK